MPWTEVDTESTLQHLSILDADGTLDEKLEPDLSGDLLRQMHRCMLLSRRFDERMLSMQRQGRLGTFAPVRGQEATQIGAAAVLEPTDWVVQSYRETAANLWRGIPLEGLLLFNAGFNEGGRIPEEQCDTPISIPVGSQMLHAVGLAYGLRIQQKEGIAMTFFGDGATSQGDFHEAMNFAGVFDSPVVFVCENNQWAISLPRSHQTRSRTLAQKAFAYDLPCAQVDGNDILAVYTACREAAERARKDHVPTLIECVTYRLSVHTTVDDPSKYREQEEVERWKERDPLPRFQKYLTKKGILSDDQLEELEEEIKSEIDEAVHGAEEQIAKLTDPSVIFDHLFAEIPPYLAEQREQFREDRESRAGAEKGQGSDG